jgi:hypothetical protein
MLRSLMATLVAAPALVAFTVAADASNPARGADVYGVGGGSFVGKLTNFDTSMHSGPNGGFGHVQLRRDGPFFPLDVYVDVSCVQAVPGLTPEVHYSGRVRSADPVPNFLGLRPGDPVSGYAADGGNPSAGVPVDSLTLFTEAVLPDCRLSVWRPPVNNVGSGNIQVKFG